MIEFGRAGVRRRGIGESRDERLGPLDPRREDAEDPTVGGIQPLHRLFADPDLLPTERLEQTGRWDHYRLPTGVTLRVPCGWFLWMIAIEHEAVEHADDLALGRAITIAGP